MQADSSDARCDSLQARCDSLQTRCDSIQACLDGMLPVKKLIAEKITVEFSGYPDLKFAELDMAVLDSVTALCGSLMMTELSPLQKRLETARSNKAIYESLSAIVNSPYNKDLTASATFTADSLSSSCSMAQKTELDKVSTALKMYPEAVKEIKETVEWIHQMMELYRPSGSPSAAKSTLETILKSRKGVYDSVIKKVPYLADLYDSMVKNLRANPLVENDAEKTLLGI